MNSPVRMTRMNKDEHEAPENLHNESPGKREKNRQRKHNEKKLLDEKLNHRRKRVGGRGKQRQLGTNEMNFGIK